MSSMWVHQQSTPSVAMIDPFPRLFGKLNTFEIKWEGRKFSVNFKEMLPRECYRSDILLRNIWAVWSFTETRMKAEKILHRNFPSSERAL